MTQLVIGPTPHWSLLAPWSDSRSPVIDLLAISACLTIHGETLCPLVLSSCLCLHKEWYCLIMMSNFLCIHAPFITVAAIKMYLVDNDNFLYVLVNLKTLWFRVSDKAEEPDHAVWCVYGVTSGQWAVKVGLIPVKNVWRSCFEGLLMFIFIQSTYK